MAYYNCLLLDVDGTLLDFDAAEQAAFDSTMAYFFPDTQINIEDYREINNALWAELEQGKIKQDRLVIERFARLFIKLGLKAAAAQVNEYYLSQLESNGPVIDGALEALEELAEVATIAIVTNGIERVQNGRLKLSGIIKYADGVYVSQNIGAAKPNRKIFDTALNSLGITNREKVLVVGDSLKADIKGGISAGLDTCWCNFKELPVEGSFKPTHTVRGFEELLRVVMDEEELQNVGSTEKRHKL